MNTQEIVERLKIIFNLSFKPVDDLSDEAIKTHWKYNASNHIQDVDERISYVAGYLHGRSIESENLREQLKSLILELTHEI